MIFLSMERNLRDLKLFTDAKIKQFEKAGIETAEDLLRFYPRDYRDYTNPVKDFSLLKVGEYQSFIGKITSIKRKPNFVLVKVADIFGRTVNMFWFGGSGYFVDRLNVGVTVIAAGKITYNDMYKSFTVSSGLISTDISELQRIIPVYRKIKGMSDEYLKEAVRQVLELYKNSEDFIQEETRAEFGLISEYSAFWYIHNPETMQEVKSAKIRFIFDTLFCFNFKTKFEEKKLNMKSDFIVHDNNKIIEEIKKTLPYSLTEDQDNVVSELLQCFSDNKRVNALIQGDVGSGKTIVALLLMSVFMSNGIQSCLIAPTEVLAKQHYKDFLDIFPEEYKDKICFLSGSSTIKQKKEINKKISEGEYLIIIGTHAVIQPSVEYQNLGLVVIDEQHRFGVKQREYLLSREKIPHMINLSATPIPRTVAISAYGNNIKLFVIKTKPCGRKPIITKQISTDTEMRKAIIDTVNKKHQVYVICPLIDESESERMANVKSVKETYSEFTDENYGLSGVRTCMISGDMKQKDIDAVLADFLEHKYDVLISTTIVEVGVNIPNATAIIIKNSERFGLAQLHQLRGRVGRSKYQSFCYLQTEDFDEKTDIIVHSNDGFAIANEDLRLRGPGEILGDKQSGASKHITLMLAYPKFFDKINHYTEKIYNTPELYNKYSFLNNKNFVLL